MLLNRSFSGSGYSKTVLVPRSKFPARHDPKVEIKTQEDTKFSSAYLEQDLARKPYVIHDGPPFANGAIHLGHAVNKILKDIAARYAMITGHRVEFITGWDCHGLPIELHVLKILEQQQRQASYGGSLAQNSTASPEQFRTRARAFAKSQIDLQMASFKRMGLLTDWNKRYTTDDPSYVANQLRAFSQLFEQKLVFKDLMPVNWSLVNKTAISDADIEYKNNHISKSAYVICEIISPSFYSDLLNRPLYALVWTTTPWTLAENRAIGFNKQETYCVIRAQKTTDHDTLNILSSIDTAHKTHQLLQRLGYQSEILTYVPGNSLCGLKYKPVLNSIIQKGDSDNEPRPFLHGEFVDGAKGTGLVHLAPNYGDEDFTLVKSKGLPIQDALVGANGKFGEAAGEILKDKYIFTDGTQEILSALDSERALLFTELTQHSYPYETRTDQPVITRTSQQIFLDTSRIVPRCLRAFENCSFYPEHRRLQIINSLATSPNWCISRQRIWGTPIPVLYHKDDIEGKKMISHPDLIEHLCKLLYRKRSMDFWWTAENEDIVPQELLQQCKLPYKSDDLVRGMDIFDVWSDSGLSWHTLASGLNDNKTQADLYLEGSDQIRGWFSASTLLSMALRGCLPSKRFFVHGFALDDKGRKMSKSQGNVVDPLSLCESYGVDPVRLWAAKTAGGNRDIIVKQQEFKSSTQESINKIRITLKYLIGALEDHDAIDGKLDPTTLRLFDQYYLDKLYRFGSTIDEQYKKYRYDSVVKTINDFIVNDFSPIYIDSVKDLLYCDEPDSERRRSCMTVLNIAYNVLTRCLYPIVPHIVYEAGQYMRSSEPLNEWQDLGYSALWKNNVLHNQVENLIEIRRQTAKILGQNFGLKDKNAILHLSDKKLYKSLSKIVQSGPDLFAELFKTSNFLISYNEKLSKPENVEEHPISDTDSSSSSRSETAGLSMKTSGESLTFLSYWTSGDIGDTDSYCIGGTLKVNGGLPTKFELSYRKTANKKCPRCRRFATIAPEADIVSEDACLCDRCKGALRKLEMLD